VRNTNASISRFSAPVCFSMLTLWHRTPLLLKFTGDDWFMMVRVVSEEVSLLFLCLHYYYIF
jgi:hypothetical protein